MVKGIRRLPDAELNVMQAIWDCAPPVSRLDLEQHLSPAHPMALTTLLTLLSRLTEKGFLITEKSGRSNCYTPTVSRQEYLSAQSHSFFDQLCGRNISVFASALCDSGLTKEELAELKRLLEEGGL